MAIVDGVKNVVAANIAAAQNKSISSNLKRVTGNLFGGDLRPDRGSLGGPPVPRKSPGKYTTKNLAYPEGVENDPTQGHYIIFEILAQNPGKLEAFKRKQKASAFGEGMTLEQLNAIANRNNVDGAPNENTITDSKPKNSSIQLKKNSTTRLDTAISLYMPPSVQVQYSVKYGNQEIGAVAETIGAATLGAIQAFQGKQGGWWDKTMAAGEGAVSPLWEGAKASAAQFGMKKVAGWVQGGDALIAIERGIVITPRMELMFEGMDRRSFSYEFTFIPKSEKEAEIVEEIVKMFKIHMMPDFANGFGSAAGVDGVREMTIPDHFNIRYMYKGEINTHLNLISTCALQNMSVDYGAERFTAYAGGRPQTTKISLSFTEFNIMSKQHIKEGH
jgi:hypothetical protein